MLKKPLSLNMLLYAPAKINLGLQVLFRRDDGFHELSSLMYPLPFFDLIEIQEQAHGRDPLSLSESGLRSRAKPENNLCSKAWEAIMRHCSLPPVSIHLHKQIPVGAGLGGGSSDASTVLLGLNKLASPALSREELHSLAASLGSDCPFFLEEGPKIMTGRGELLHPFDEVLKGLYLVLLSPGIHVSTAEAYAGVIPARPEQDLETLLRSSVETWPEKIVNDFEASVFLKHPRIAELKQALYAERAEYASMTGSGSALYGIFKSVPDLNPELSDCVIWKGWL